MALGLGDRARFIDEVESCLEIGEAELLFDVVLIDHLPAAHLRSEVRQLLSVQGRPSASARHAMFFRQAHGSIIALTIQSRPSHGRKPPALPPPTRPIRTAR